jgi:hypothetical protein
MTAAALDAIRDLIQEDVGNRGLRTDPAANLVTACPGDFAAACRSIAENPRAAVAVVTGFYIPHANPPAAETDGPLGALFLARALTPLGIRVALMIEPFGLRAVQVGLDACGLARAVKLVNLEEGWPGFWRDFGLTHLVALERVGPSHTLDSLRKQLGDGPAVEEFRREVPAEHWDRCHSMRGVDITDHMNPAHLLFEAVQLGRQMTTIGIGDGGNEIGMGKISWEVIRRNIPRGGLVACRVPADHLVVCGVSNWGAYGLATGVRLLRGQPPEGELFDPERERALLELMVRAGPLEDGVTAKQTATVDGLAFERYVEPLRRLGEIR